MSAASNRWKIALGCLAFLVCAAAHAAVKCDKTALSDGETLSRYLLDYGGACVGGEAEKVEAGWEIKPRGEPNAFKVIPAWTGIAGRFAALPRPSGSQLSSAYEKLAARAERATAAFKADVKEGTGTGASFYGNLAWRLPPNLKTDFPDPKELYFPDLPGGEGTIDIAGPADADCKDAASALCRDALAGGKELMFAWRLAHDLSNRLSVSAVSKIGEQVALKRALWNRYLYQSKPMLPLDHIATDFFDGRWKHSDQYPDGVREPPDTQYFFLHPSVAVEQLNSAPDGQQLKPVLVVEVFGANRWRDDRRWINAPLLRSLSGASIALTYADRAGVTDIGKGVIMTFENVYSIGVMRYESKTSVLFSIDLANLWREKYKDKYETFRNGSKNELF
ncbi:MAG: hypothetical protein WD886_01440 [Burkholderiales bacterium]